MTAFAAERSGVYRAPADVLALRQRAEAARLAWIAADLARVGGKAELMAALGSAAQLPAGFGMNWDALADGLGDLSWRPAVGYVLHLRHTAAAQGRLGAQWATLLEVLHQAAREWKSRGKPFVAFVDDADLPVWAEVP